MDNLPAAVLTLSLAGGYLTTVLVSALTQGWPSRPTWVGAVAAMAFGILSCTIMFIATVPATTAIDRQMLSVILAAGVLSGGAAMGSAAAQSTAEAKRDQAKALEVTRRAATVTAKPSSGVSRY